MTDHHEYKSNELDKVAGAGLFSRNTDEEYADAGVEVVGPGVLWNDSYKFKGTTISRADANFLVLYRYYLGHVADNIPDAREEFDWYARTYLEY